MKKFILFIFMAATMAAFGQSKKDTLKKPQWTFDGTKTVTFTIDNKITLSASDLDAYIFVNSQGGPQQVQQSPRLTGAQISALMASYQRVSNLFQPVADSVNARAYRAYNDYVAASKAKFTQDTIKLYHKKN